MNTIELTNEDALLFAQFQKRYAFIKLLESLGAFDIKSGNIKINFDEIGAIGVVEVNRYYRP